MFEYNLKYGFLCISKSLGGLELTTIHLADFLKNRGLDSVVIIPSGSPMEEKAFKSNLIVEYLNPKMKYGDLISAIKLSAIIKKHKIDRLIIMQSKDINLAAMAKMFYSKMKLVYYQQMQSGRQKKDFFHNWIYSRLSLWVALTQKMKNDVINCTSVPENRIRVIPLGQDSKKFNPKLFNPMFEKKYFNLPKDKYLIGMVGRLDPKKGQEIFLNAIPRVIENNRNVHFILVGEETRGEEGYKIKLLDICNKLNITEYVTFIPFIEEVPRFLSTLDIFVLPSDEETFGLVVIEAMAMEKAVIATDAGGVPEIIHHGVDGLLIKPRNIEALSGSIIKILDDSNLRLSLSAEARKAAVQKFDFARQVEEFTESISYI